MLLKKHQCLDPETERYYVYSMVREDWDDINIPTRIVVFDSDRGLWYDPVDDEGFRIDRHRRGSRRLHALSYGEFGQDRFNALVNYQRWQATMRALCVEAQLRPKPIRLSSRDIHYVAARVAQTWRPGYLYAVFVVMLDDEGSICDLKRVFETFELKELFDFLENEIEDQVAAWGSDDWMVGCYYPTH